MTVSSSETVRLSYSGDGATKTFTTPPYDASADLLVILVDSAGAETQQTETTHWSAPTSGGGSAQTLTMVTAPAATETLVIISEPVVEQQTDYVDNNAFPAETTEAALDRLTRISQRHRDLIARAVTLNDSATAPSSGLTIDLSQASKVLGINAAGDALSYLSPISAASSSIAISGTPTDEQVVSYDATSGVLTYRTIATGLADGDYGDVTVSENGTVITIDAGAIDYAELAAALLSGSDASLITGTAGSENTAAMWNGDGDLVEIAAAAGDALPITAPPGTGNLDATVDTVGELRDAVDALSLSSSTQVGAPTEFTTSGTWTKATDAPAGATHVMVAMWGGGGAGRNNWNANPSSPGGAGGAFALLIIDIASLGATETVTIGAGGASTGADGGTTSFGSHKTAPGGVGAPQTGSTAGGKGEHPSFSGSDGGAYTEDGVAATFGGASGGGAAAGGTTTGGMSLFGGDGGDGGLNTSSDGSVPGGGGGSMRAGSPVTSGGDGLLRVYYFTEEPSVGSVYSVLAG